MAARQNNVVYLPPSDGATSEFMRTGTNPPVVGLFSKHGSTAQVQVKGQRGREV